MRSRKLASMHALTRGPESDTSSVSSDEDKCRTSFATWWEAEFHSLVAEERYVSGFNFDHCIPYLQFRRFSFVSKMQLGTTWFSINKKLFL